MDEGCPICGSKDYESYNVRDPAKMTDWIEHRCLKCNAIWRYRKGETEGY